MKKVLIVLLLIPVFTMAQTIKELDFISPMHDGVVAVNKNDSWGFINEKGNLIIDFRSDLVLTKNDGGIYPVFKNDRCIITIKKEGITYFGYIDKTGNTVIEPKYLNALNFKDNIALVLSVLSQKRGTNDILDKPVVFYKYFEVTIDKNGNVKDYLNPKGTSVILDKKYLENPPKITSKLISENLFAVRSGNEKWMIKSIK